MILIGDYATAGVNIGGWNSMILKYDCQKVGRKALAVSSHRVLSFCNGPTVCTNLAQELNDFPPAVIDDSSHSLTGDRTPGESDFKVAFKESFKGS